MPRSCAPRGRRVVGASMKIVTYFMIVFVFFCLPGKSSSQAQARLMVSPPCTNGVIKFYVTHEIPGTQIDDHGQVEFSGIVDGEQFSAVALPWKWDGTMFVYRSEPIAQPPISTVEIMSAEVTADDETYLLRNPGVYDAVECSVTAVKLSSFTAVGIW